MGRKRKENRIETWEVELVEINVYYETERSKAGGDKSSEGKRTVRDR